jgi:hypothetical protein
MPLVATGQAAFAEGRAPGVSGSSSFIFLGRRFSLCTLSRTLFQSMRDANPTPTYTAVGGADILTMIAGS